MARLNKYNSKFSIKMSTNNANFDLLSPDVVHFHLECAYAVFAGEWSLRYYPHPTMYIKDATRDDIEVFFSVWCKHWDVESFLISTELQENSSMLGKLLQFILMTCPIKIIPHSVSLGCDGLYLVKFSDKKESQFAKRYVSYLFHSTREECVYSICRNGIKDMGSDDSDFQVNGCYYGNGIYLAPDIRSKYGTEVVLCFAVKDKDRLCVDSRRRIYLAQEKDICLRAIIWNYDRDAPSDRIVEHVTNILTLNK